MKGYLSNNPCVANRRSTSGGIARSKSRGIVTPRTPNLSSSIKVLCESPSFVKERTHVQIKVL